MYIKLDRSWNGHTAGEIIEIDDKYYNYVIQNKIGTKTEKPNPEKKVIEPEYETKEEKKVTTRRKKTKKDATE